MFFKVHVHTITYITYHPRLIYQQGSVKLSQVHFSMIPAGDAARTTLLVGGPSLNDVTHLGAKDDRQKGDVTP